MKPRYIKLLTYIKDKDQGLMDTTTDRKPLYTSLFCYFKFCLSQVKSFGNKGFTNDQRHVLKCPTISIYKYIFSPLYQVIQKTKVKKTLQIKIYFVLLKTILFVKKLTKKCFGKIQTNLFKDKQLYDSMIRSVKCVAPAWRQRIFIHFTVTQHVPNIKSLFVSLF